jgi:hypothetical protein
MSRIRYRYWVSFFGLLVLGGCGGNETTTPIDPAVTVTANGKGSEFKALSPVSFELNPASPNDPLNLVSGSSPLQLFQYDAVVEADLDSSKMNARSFVTGVGVDITDTSGNALNTVLFVEAREFDSSTGNFSGTSKIYSSAPGADIQMTQHFGIVSATSPNFLLTGMGFKMRNARMKTLSLQRKTFEKIFQRGTSISGGTQVLLPVGWAATGVYLRAAPPSVSTTTTQFPFIQDAVLYVGQLVNR